MQNNLQQLLDNTTDLNVSILMPTYRAGKETRQNPIRFKNLLQEIQKKLPDDWSPKTTAEFLAPLMNLLDDFEFWQQQSDGLALFLNEKMFVTYSVPLNMPELATISEHFHIKPLLPYWDENGLFYLLQLSQQQIYLYRCTRYSIEQIELPSEISTSLEESLRYDDAESQLQMHSGAGGGEEPAFHGHDPTDKSKHKVEIMRFFQEIDQGVKQILGDKKAPLILAGVDYLLPLYQKANTYSYLRVAPSLKGNFDNTELKTLHQQAIEVMQPYFQEAQKDAIETYKQVTSNDAGDLSELLFAAHMGRIQTLMVAQNVQQWGFYDITSQQVTIDNSPHSEDLLNLAVTKTLLYGGKVHILPKEEIPSDKPLAAIYRF